MQCLEGVRHLCSVLLKCCAIDLKQPKGLEDPEVLARETVCMSALPALFAINNVYLRIVLLLAQSAINCVLFIL